MQAVGRVQGNPPKKQAVTSNSPIFVKVENRLEKVVLREILFIEGARDYRKIHAAGRRLLTLQTFAEFERQVPPNIICRVHKSYMVSLDKIDSIEKGRIKVKDHVIPISETYKEQFFKLINHSTKE
jgi:two-component system LytT family response regulator